MRFETLAIHADGGADPATGDLAPPIHLATTFRHGPASEPLHGRLYIREGNPTQDRLERALAALDGGERALAFASGMAATTALLEALPPGGHVLFHQDLYSGVRALARDRFPRWGLAASFVDLADPGAARQAATDGTAAIWLETPTNPRLEVLDLDAAAALARELGALLVVDGTFATPALQRPIEHGADVVLHSATKYLGGHSDVGGGALVFRRADALAARVETLRHDTGGVASPFSSWLVLRGLRSLACRVERHSASALAVARALAPRDDLAAVLYPGLPSHPGHAVAARQMRGGFGGMLSIRVAGGLARTLAVAAGLEIFTNATSLGGCESLVEHRASSEGPDTTAPEDLLRLSIGLEHADDLVADLEHALERA
jgi:cystathionine gamma-synthase